MDISASGSATAVFALSSAGCAIVTVTVWWIVSVAAAGGACRGWALVAEKYERRTHTIGGDISSVSVYVDVIVVEEASGSLRPL